MVPSNLIRFRRDFCYREIFLQPICFILRLVSTRRAKNSNHLMPNLIIDHDDVAELEKFQSTFSLMVLWPFDSSYVL